MTSPVPGGRDAEANIRWRAWEARGLASDRRSATVMGGLAGLAALGLAVWLVIQLV